MPLPQITFIKGQGGLGRPLPGQDYISALVFYTASLPSGFSTSARIKVLYSLLDAENAGIVDTATDATAATGSILATAIGANGDTLELKVIERSVTDGVQTVSLGTYTKGSGDTTTALVATGIASVINAGTVNHGYSASVGSSTVTITAPKRLGLLLNTGTNLTATYSSGATLAGTLTQFTGGVGSKLAVYHYHIKEFFRIQPKGILYVGFFAIPSTYAFTEITTMQNFAVGAIRQIGIYKDSAAYAAGDLTLINDVCEANDEAKKPLSALYAADLTATSDISAIADLSTRTDNKVTSVIGQDGGFLGDFLYRTYGKSITCLGAELGAVAKSKVGESIAWIAKFDMSNGFELETLAFANGTLYSDSSVTDNLLSSLNDKRHTFLRKFVGISGSYFNDSHTAIAPTSDYCQIENNRTIDKAIRGVYAALLPSLNAPIQLLADGTLSDNTVAFFESQAGVNLDQMVRDAELSAFEVTVNPNQNVLTTNKIIVAVELVINGVARFIEVPIGFKPSIV